MGITRQLIFGIDPYGTEPLIQTLEFSDVVDANTEGKAFTCGIVPKGRSYGVSLIQEAMFLGTTSFVGKTYHALMDTLAQDGTEAVTATAVTQRIDPDARIDSSRRNPLRVTKKRFLTINFNGKSPLRTGVSIQYCLDGDPISGDAVTWIDFLGNVGDTKLSFDGALGNYIHIRLVDSSNKYHESVLPPFSIEYISEGEEREGGSV